MRLPSRHWCDLATTDFARVDMSAQIAVLPLAATEQHGPHLPLGTDAFIMQGYLDRVLKQLPEELPAIFLPTQRVGCSIEHRDFAGTLSLSASSALAAWYELTASIAAVGCRKLVIVNSHGGNSALIDILKQQLRAELGMLAVAASWPRFGYPTGLFSAVEREHGIHGGAIETSLMLAFRPDLVRKGLVRNVVPSSFAIEREFTWLRTGRPTGFGWMAQDLSERGTAGDATAATPEKGEMCAEHGAAAFIALLRDVAAFDLAMLRQAAG